MSTKAQKKENRVDALVEFIFQLHNLKNSYLTGSSAWVLIDAARGLLRSLHMLEKEDFDPKTLGIKDD
jgi:hypothetical protein